MLIPFKRQPVPFSQQISFTFKLFLIVSVVEVVNLLSGRLLNAYGIIPRHVPQLWGIFTSPWIHGNIAHYLSNLAPLLLFTMLTFQHGRRRFWLVTFGIVVFGGLGVWVFGRPAAHIGASGLIFGYFGFLIAAGLISREFKLLAISLAVVFFYGGLIWGILPQASYISYEAHLFGFIAGIAMALLVGRAR